MHSLEANVKKESEYYVYQPSAVAPRIYLYPTTTGLFHYQAGYHLRRANFNSFLLLYIEEGSCMIMENGMPARVRQGCFALIDCFVPHEYYYEEDASTLWLHFDGPLARNYYELLTEGRSHVLTVQNPYPAVRAMRKILQLFQEAKRYNEADMSALITQILTQLLDAPVKPGSSSTRDEIIDRSLAYIGEHFREPISLKDLSEKSNMSLYHFTRVFAAETGYTPHQYLIATRINAAKYLLLTPGELSIKDIAYRSGFNSESSFCSTFRKWEKLTPREYQARNLLAE